MWRMTLKQRRRHGELMALLERMKNDPYLQVPEGYTFGDNPEEDEKYKSVQESFGAAVTEVHALEVASQTGD